MSGLLYACQHCISSTARRQQHPVHNIHMTRWAQLQRATSPSCKAWAQLALAVACSRFVFTSQWHGPDPWYNSTYWLIDWMSTSAKGLHCLPETRTLTCFCRCSSPPASGCIKSHSYSSKAYTGATCGWPHSFRQKWSKSSATWLLYIKTHIRIAKCVWKCGWHAQQGPFLHKVLTWLKYGAKSW